MGNPKDLSVSVSPVSSRSGSSTSEQLQDAQHHAPNRLLRKVQRVLPDRYTSSNNSNPYTRDLPLFSNSKSSNINLEWESPNTSGKLASYGTLEGDSPQTGEIIHTESNQLNRSLSARQVSMIAIAGVIGTGLFLGTGKSLAEGGPASLLICYGIVGIVVYFTMLALVEMATFMPVSGSFCTYATRFVDPSFGFALQWNYWFNDAVSTASDLTALQLVIGYWTNGNEHFPAWAVSLGVWVVLILLNVGHVRIYGEMEFWLAILKVVTIIVFIILGIVVNCGANTSHEYIGFKYWNKGTEDPFGNTLAGAFAGNGFRGFAKVFVTASFAYGGTESIGITAGETKDPHKNMPKVARTVFWRIMLFYIVGVLIIGINVPYTYPGLSDGTSATSPFTLVFQMAGSSVAGSFMNAVVVTSVLSAGNHALFAGTRLLWSMGAQGFAPRFFCKVTGYRVPVLALISTSLVSVVCFATSFIGAGQLWNWLQALVGVSNQISWVAIGITSVKFRRALKAQTKLHLLPYRNWTDPWGPYIVIVGVSVMILVQGWSSLSPWNASSFFQSYVELGVFPLMYVAWKLFKRTKVVGARAADLETDRYEPSHTNQ